MSHPPFEPLPPAYEPSSQAEADPFGVRALLRMLVRRRLVIFGAAAIVATLVIALSMLSTPLYQASALVLLDPRQERVVNPGQDLVSDLPSTNTTVVDSEIEVLRSRQMALRLVDHLDLVNDPRWNPTLGADDGSALDASLQDESRRPQTSAAEREELIKQSIADAVQGSIVVRRRGMTYAIDVGAVSTDPQTAAIMANALVEVYLRFQMDNRLATVERANSWLTSRLDELRIDVQEKERAAEEYRRENGLLDAAGSTLTESQVTEVQASVLAARADVAEKQARYRQVQELVSLGGSPESIADVINSGSIRELRARQSEVERQLAEYESQLLDGHPRLQAARISREDLQRQIEVEIGRISISLRNEVAVAQARLRTLEGSLNTTRGALMTDNTALVRLRELEREAAAAQGVYESYLRRLQEVASQDRLTSTDARLVSAAVAPRSPFSPNFRAAFALALVLGLVLGAGAGVLVELIDHRIGSADNLEEKVGVPAIATIPVLSKRHLRLLPPEDQNPAGFIVEKPMSGFAEAFRVLRTYVHYSNLDARNRAIAVTSSAPNEGKTTSVMCLARIAAASGDKVVVVDCDLRRRSLNRALDIEPRAGLLQVLAGEKAWRDVLVEDRHTSVAFLPLADAVFTSRDVFGSDAMRQLVAELKDEYDLVLFDCAPILAVAETRVIAELADAVIIVARWDKTAIGALRASIHSAKSVGSNVLGIALNYVNPDAPGRSTYNEALYYYKANQSYYAT